MNGVLYSHILNPKTGLGLTTNITTTVIAPRGIDADGLATTLNVLGVDHGLAFIETQPGASAVVATGSTILTSTSFRSLFPPPPPPVGRERVSCAHRHIKFTNGNLSRNYIL